MEAVIRLYNSRTIDVRKLWATAVLLVPSLLFSWIRSTSRRHILQNVHMSRSTE